MWKSGVPDSVIMKITGHSTLAISSVRTIDEGDKLNAVIRMEEFLQSVDQNVDQANIPKKEGADQ